MEAADITWATSITGSYQTLGFGVLSSTAVFNRRGYAGYEHAFELAGSKYHVRHRFLDSELGPQLASASIATCEGNRGWDDYLLLHHYDRTLDLDTLPRG